MQRHYFTNKVRLVKAVVFLVVVYGCDNWVLKIAEYQRIDPSEVWCWRRLLRVLWTARRFNQSVLNNISPEHSLTGPMLLLKLQIFGHWYKVLTHWKIYWCWDRLKGEGEGDSRGGDGWMASPNQQTWVWVSSGSWWWTGKSSVLWSMGLKSSNMTEWLNWTYGVSCEFGIYALYYVVEICFFDAQLFKSFKMKWCWVLSKASLIRQLLKESAWTARTLVWFLDWEDPLEKI